MLSILWKHTCLESVYPLLNSLISEGKPSSPALFKRSTAFDLGGQALLVGAQLNIV
jgi:hypothetical protein